MTQPDTDMLWNMLTYRRPHGSKAERHFINRFIAPTGAKRDSFGNLYLEVGNPTVLWSAHTDTVHRMGGRQRIQADDIYIKLAEDEDKSNCLGADNAAGVWILLEMIRANVPGLYVFHRQEESGCLGAHHFAQRNADMLHGIQAAVAFDRRYTGSIISHQMGLRSASEAFCHSMADIIGMGHTPDPTGSYTDTSAYTDIIPECTNISAGFANEHSKSEKLNVAYLLSLREAMVEFDAKLLEIERDPKVVDFDSYNDRGFGKPNPWDNYRALVEMCKRDPQGVADFLDMSGIDARDVEDHIWQSLGLSSM